MIWPDDFLVSQFLDHSGKGTVWEYRIVRKKYNNLNGKPFYYEICEVKKGGNNSDWYPVSVIRGNDFGELFP